MKIIKPMLAVLGTKKDFGRKNFIYELKLDGARALCLFEKGKFWLINRWYKDITSKYPEFDFQFNAKSCILDGEIVVYDDNKIPNFKLLQKRELLETKALIKLESKRHPAEFVVFDILSLDGKNITNKSLKERKEILERVIKEGGGIKKIFYTKEGKKLWDFAAKRKLEGIMAKDFNSRYYPGKKAQVWLKIKFFKTIDCIIAGYAAEKMKVSALALAAYANKKLRYIGIVRKGLSQDFLGGIYGQLKLLETKKACVKYDGKAHINWVKPKIICELKYQKFSKDKLIIAPVFLRLRNDKLIRDCTLSGEKLY